MTLLLLSGCGRSTHTVMTLETFQETHIGMSEELLVKTYGEPLNRYYRDNGEVVIYEYVERFAMGTAEKNIVQARRYYFFVKEGKIISRQMAIKNQPAYDQMNQL